jgi:predicted GNAT family acetyltransferase
MLNLVHPNRRLAMTQVVGSQEAETSTVFPLAAEDEAEVLAFMKKRPLHTFGMAGFIRINGLVSPANPGTFYACRDRKYRLDGVALIGHFILFDTPKPSSAENAIRAFARLAEKCSDIGMVLGEEENVARFWNHYSGNRRTFNTHRYILLAKNRGPAEAYEPVHNLRRATSHELDLVVAAHSQSLSEDRGVDPLETNLEAFVQRCAERIRQGRTWIWTEGQTLIAKAEVTTDTRQVVYLEAIWVNPEVRRNGYGSRFVSQLSNTLLEQTASVCLLVKEENTKAQGLYSKLGYRPISYYRAIFV